MLILYGAKVYAASCPERTHDSGGGQCSDTRTAAFYCHKSTVGVNHQVVVFQLMCVLVGLQILGTFLYLGVLNFIQESVRVAT